MRIAVLILGLVLGAVMFLQTVIFTGLSGAVGNNAARTAGGGGLIMAFLWLAQARIGGEVDELKVSSADKQIRALAFLRSLERILQPEQIGRDYAIEASHVKMYDQALDYLRESGESIEEFRFPQNEFVPSPSGRGPASINRDRLYGLVTALIDYFAIRQAVLDIAQQLKERPERMIGFEPVRSQDGR